MTTLDHLLWFLATAIMTITVLTIGTLAAAGLLPRRRRSRRSVTPAAGAHERRGGEAS